MPNCKKYNLDQCVFSLNRIFKEKMRISDRVIELIS